MNDFANFIASVALEQYAKLKIKATASNWTVLAAFVIHSTNESIPPLCVSIGTGLKVLPHSKLPFQGDVLFDSHAEVIARRSLLLYLYSQIELAKNEQSSCLERGEGNRWRMKKDLKLALYISTLPCGDASMYTLSLQTPIVKSLDSSAPRFNSSIDSEATILGLSSQRDPSPNELVHSSVELENSAIVRRGRVGYQSISSLRTKPGRPDSPPTTSHSCSDKLSLWSILGVQGALLSKLVERISLDLVVISGYSEFEKEEKKKILLEARRGIGGRLEGKLDELVGEYTLKVPEILFTTLNFLHSRESLLGIPDLVSAPGSMSWVHDQGIEILVNGTKHGSSQKRKNGEPLGPKLRSRICKLSLYQTFLNVTNDDHDAQLQSYYNAKHSYGQQNSNLVHDSLYQRAKQTIRGNNSPFAGWLVSGEPFERFNGAGHLPDEE